MVRVNSIILLIILCAITICICGCVVVSTTEDDVYYITDSEMKQTVFLPV